MTPMVERQVYWPGACRCVRAQQRVHPTVPIQTYGIGTVPVRESFWRGLERERPAETGRNAHRSANVSTDAKCACTESMQCSLSTRGSATGQIAVVRVVCRPNNVVDGLAELECTK
jgi:hypothetical protein